MIEATMRKAGGNPVAEAAAKAALAQASAPGAIDISGASSLESQILGTPDNGTAQSTGVVTAPRAGAVQRGTALNGGGGMQGFSTDDIKFPVLKVVNGSGPLAQKYPQGTLILADEEFLPSPPLDLTKPNLKFPRFDFVPVNLVKRFREKLDDAAYKAGQQPRYADNLQEVEELGGSIVWQNRTRSWEESSTNFILIRRPEGCEHSAFALDINGSLWAPAVFYAAGSQYNDFTKTIVSTAALALQVETGKTASGAVIKEPMIFKRVWGWETKKKQKGQYGVFCPEVRVTKEETTEELRTICRTMKGSAAESEAVE